MAGPKPEVSCSMIGGTRRLAHAGYKTALAIVVSAFLFGCGSPNAPTPRHAIVPMPVSDLSARQVGDAIILEFTLPDGFNRPATSYGDSVGGGLSEYAANRGPDRKVTREG